MSKISKLLVVAILSMALLLFNNCGKSGFSDSPASPVVPTNSYTLSLSFTRIPQAGPDPFDVTVTLKNNGVALPGQTLQLNIPSGSVSAVTDNGDGTYKFRVTPPVENIYPVQVSYGGVSVKRTAIVVTTLAPGLGQPLMVPGDFVNTEGYEDGANITPDGQYLFTQTGPIYFMGVAAHATICADPAYSGYNVLDCAGKPDSKWVTDTIGPYTAPERPNFRTGGIDLTTGKIKHINMNIPGAYNGIARFPNVFYGFKRQADGTFAEPFRVGFNDDRNTANGTGINLKPIPGTNNAQFVVAWNNYHNDIGGDGKMDIYHGTLTLGQEFNFADYTYTGEMFNAPTNLQIAPMPFASHAGGQCNPHLYYGSDGIVKSIWVDDEDNTYDLTVFRLTAGTFPNGTWTSTLLPSVINTAAHESMPFFNGHRLYLMRAGKIVYHEYVGSGHADYGNNAAWGPEVTFMHIVGGQYAVGSITAIGEPTFATYDGKNYMYFVFTRIREPGVTPGYYDINADIGFVEVP